MSHSLGEATSEALKVPTPVNALIMHPLRAPYLFSVGQGYVPDIQHHPKSGTQQGDPLSPALYSVMVSIVIHLIKQACPDAMRLMYADDLTVFFPGSREIKRRNEVLAVVRNFNEY